MHLQTSVKFRSQHLEYVKGRRYSHSDSVQASQEPDQHQSVWQRGSNRYVPHGTSTWLCSQPYHLLFRLYKNPLLLEIVWIIVVMYKCMTEVQLSIVIVHEHWWYMNMLMSIHYIDDAWTCPCKDWCFMNMPMYYMYIDDTWTCPCIVF